MTKIEWAERTWNPVVGCGPESPGCTNCYAMKMAARIERMGTAPHYAGLTQSSKAGPVWTGKIALAPDSILKAPLRRKKPTLYFVNSMGDPFHPNVPDHMVDLIFAIMALCPQHTFQLLTKHAGRMREYILGLNCDGARRFNVADAAEKIATDFRYWKGDGPTDWDLAVAEAIQARHWPLPNVWLGVSAEDQTRADQRIPDLLDTPAAIRFVSYEPALGPVDFRRWFHDEDCTGLDSLEHGVMCPCRGYGGPHEVTLDWIICGGESGPNARPMHPDWARSVRDQCAAAGTPFLFKQWGEWVQADHTVCPDSDMSTNKAVWLGWDGKQAKPSHHGLENPIGVIRTGKKRAGRLLDGVEYNGFPGAV